MSAQYSLPITAAMKSSRLLQLVLALLPLRFAGAQITTALGFESLYKDINDVNVSFSCWSARGALRPTGDCPGSKNGYGIEVIYNLSKIPRGLRTPNEAQPASITKKCPAGGGPCAVDTVFNVASGYKDKHYWMPSIGLGYGQFSGFAANDTSITLRGTVRESPSVSMYLQHANGDLGAPWRWFAPYMGVRSGLLQLSNVYASTHAPANTSVTTYSAAGSVFQLGAVAGLQMNLFGDKVHVFGEYAQHLRKFSGVQWSGSPIPQSLPQVMNFSGSQWALGMEFRVR